VESIDSSGQWIVIMGFLVSVGIVFLAVILNQFVLVGQTTAEGVLEFSKNDIRDIRDEIISLAHDDELDNSVFRDDMEALALSDKGALISYHKGSEELAGAYTRILVGINFNNGVTEYDETAAIYIP
jgi:hypothetical protein